MESRNFPRQENHLSDGNAAIDLGTSLSESPAPWNGGLTIPYDAPDGTLTRSGNPGERLVHSKCWISLPSHAFFLSFQCYTSSYLVGIA